MLIIVILALLALSIGANNKTQAFAQAADNSATNNDDNWWYVGKGAKENMYMKYQMQYYSVNNGQPFNMTIHFHKFNNTREYWLTSVLVEDGNNKGQVFNATFHLGNGNLGILPSSQIPSNMKAYQDVYSDTLDWLSASTYKGAGQSLDAKNWGRIAAPDLVIVRNLGSERVKVPGGAFDTTVFGRIDNTTEHRVWINKDLPYPVKENFKIFNENTSAWSLKDRFELLEVGIDTQGDKRAAGYSSYSLQTSDGKVYDIQYKISNGTVEKIDSFLPKALTLRIFINTTDNGNLQLKLPRQLADRIANIGGIGVAIPYTYNPIEVESTCDYRIFSIDFGHGTSQIELDGTRIGYINQAAQLASLRVNIDGKESETKHYVVETASYAKICSWQFFPEERKLRIMLDGNMEVRPDNVPINTNASGMGITIPQELLGSPYVVFVDGKQIDHTVDESDIYHTRMHFKFDKTSKLIEIVGTTAIPEFGSILSLVIGAGVIGIVVITDRMLRTRTWKG